jgi:dTMP kinase
MILAIEGVSCTGKSTLAAGLAERLGWQVIGCYHHVANDPAVLGESLAHSEAEQLAALTAHLTVEVERTRRATAALAHDGAVIVDRSVDTLLAHLRAVGRMQRLDVTATTRQARATVSDRVAEGLAIIPDLTLLLVAEPAVLTTRGACRPDLPPLYYDSVFAGHFNEHFANPVSPRCVRLDGDADRTLVLGAALAEIVKTAVALTGRP